MSAYEDLKTLTILEIKQQKYKIKLFSTATSHLFCSITSSTIHPRICSSYDTCQKEGWVYFDDFRLMQGILANRN